VKAVLEFTLPEERAEFAIASRAAMLAAVVEDIDRDLRSLIKYGQPPGAPYATGEALAEYLRTTYTGPALAQLEDAT